jgi:hypothetical protein
LNGATRPGDRHASNSLTPTNDPGHYYEVMAIFRRWIAKQAVECVKQAPRPAYAPHQHFRLGANRRLIVGSVLRRAH